MSNLSERPEPRESTLNAESELLRALQNPDSQVLEQINQAIAKMIPEPTRKIPSVIRQAIDRARKIIDEGNAERVADYSDVTLEEIERVAGVVSSKLSSEKHHEHDDVIHAREVTFAAGFPLRNRYGYAADDEDVIKILSIVKEYDDNNEAGLQIGLANAVGEIEISMHPDEPADEEYEIGIVEALRDIV